ncbi:hypothetical protein Rruber_00984 [Rhodococcus ruber]
MTTPVAPTSCPVVAHVDRRHRHHRHHHELCHDHHHHPGGHRGRPLPGHGRPLAVRRRLRASRAAAGEQERIRAQQDPQDDRGEPVGDAGEHERPGQPGNAPGFGGVAHDRGQVRADHRPERRRHQHRAHRAPPALRSGQVGAGVARLQARRGARSVDEQGREQQHRGVERRGGHHTRAAERAGGVPERQPATAPGALRDPPHGDGRRRRPDREQGAGHPGETRAAQHVLREERADGHAGRQARAAENLRGHQYGQDAALFRDRFGHSRDGTPVPSAVTLR